MFSIAGLPREINDRRALVLDTRAAAIPDDPIGLLGDGGDIASAPDSASLHLGSNDWTIECWFKSGGEKGWEVLVRKDGGFSLQVDHNDGDLVCGVYWVGGAVMLFGAAVLPINLWDGAWHHLAAVRDVAGGHGAFFVDGILQVNNWRDDVSSGACDNGTILNVLASGGGGEGSLGTIDEVRVSKVKRYTVNFAVPTTRFVTDANTLALYHFQENIGVTAADDSGNGNDLTFGGGASAPAWAPGRYN